MKNPQISPYLNTALKDLRGEQWDDVPGFEGAYQVSTHGRVKSLRRWRASGNKGGGYYTREKILRQGLTQRMNRVVGQPTFCLNVKMKQPGRDISRSTARYVYCVFVRPIDLENKNLIVSYKDGDGRNLHYCNLLLTDRSEQGKKSFRLKRSWTTFSEAAVPVRQLTMDGKLVATYSSIKEAEDKTGIFFTAIAACIEGRTYQSHGFRWESPAKPPNGLATKNTAKDHFNYYLWEKLGRPKTSRQKPIAALNLSPEDMPGEEWKPVEGTDGAYLISNMGRIRALPRFKNGEKTVWTKGQIKKLIPDGTGLQPVSCLLCQFSHEGRKYQQSVARLVYHHFIRKINFFDKTIRIKYKNKKCYDLKWDNLEL
jgi:hypothetical protein